MNRILLLWFGVMLSFASTAQNFGDGNPVWHYDAWPGWGAYRLHAKVSILKDTLFEGKQCKILRPEGKANSSYFPFKNIICADSSKVTFWSPSLLTFQTLYDFEAKKGDLWSLRLDELWSVGTFQTIFFVVDSVYSKRINNRFVTVQSLRTSEDSINLNNSGQSISVIESIGCTNFLFPWDQRAVDGGYVEGLRCFEDDSLGFYRHNPNLECNYSEVGIEEPDFGKGFILSPNPNNGRFLISNTSSLHSIGVFDIQGKQVYKRSLIDFVSDQLEVHLEGQTSGLFIVEVITQSAAIIRQKMVLRR